MTIQRKVIPLWPREHFISDARRKVWGDGQYQRGKRAASTVLNVSSSALGSKSNATLIVRSGLALSAEVNIVKAGALFIIEEIFQCVRNRPLTLPLRPVAVLIDKELS